MLLTTKLLILAYVQENTRVRIPRSIRPKRISNFYLPENEFINLYRLTKPLVLMLVQKLRPLLEPLTPKRTAFSVEAKVLCALQFYASGSDQKVLANDPNVRMSQQCVSVHIRKVTQAFSKLLLKTYVKFPAEQRIQDATKAEFHEHCGLSDVLGVIDCIHVPLIPPKDDPPRINQDNYYNLKDFHSLNAQIVCDMKQKIINVCARFPGCSEDAYIWLASNLRAHFSQQNGCYHGKGFLLGDSSYPNEPWLKIPILSPKTDADLLYNSAHAKGMAIMEKVNRTLKSRFRCLRKEKTLHYDPVTAGMILNACVILHNICLENNIICIEETLGAGDELFNTGDGQDFDDYHRDYES